ncbi:MAG: hypothetical protein FJ098_10275 [Deltaproteobacteria bacterium]|nr:hypothetical protein [Deltaproteobacteria bacterium]
MIESLLSLVFLFGPPGDPAPAGRPAVFLGVLTEQFREVCTGPMKSEWVDPHWEVGFARVTLPAGEDPAPLRGKPVLLTGRVPPDAVQGPPRSGGGGCVQMQARSDWVIGRDGVRVVRELPAAAARPSLFVADTLAPLEGLLVSGDGDELDVVFTNPLDRALEGVVVTMHYEGCYGKPGVLRRHHDAGTVPPGGQVHARFPRIARDPEAPGSRAAWDHAAGSLQVATTSPDVIMDLDVPLSTLGAAVSCPERGGRD